MEQETLQLEESKRLVEQAKTLGVTGAGVEALGAITSETLSGGTTPLDIPDVQSDGTAVASVSAATSAAKEDQKQRTQLQRELDKEQAERQAKADEQEERVRSLQEQVLGISEERETLKEERGIAGKAERVTDFTNQLEALEREELNAIRALDGQGLTDAQRSANQRQIKRQFAFEKADVALLQSAANRDLLTAQSIIDSKIQAKLEPLKLQLEFESAFLERNFDLLDQADQRAFQAKIKADEREFEQTKDLEDFRGQLLVQAAGQGASPSVIRGIESAVDKAGMIKSAGAYAGDVLGNAVKRAQLDKLQKEIDSIVSGQTTFKPKDKFDAELGLSNTFNDRTKEYQKAATQIGNIRASYNAAVESAKAGGSINAASQGVLVAFQKLLDPTSVVRESEYARSGTGASLLERIEGQAAKLKAGGAGLTAKGLEEFADTAELFLIGYTESALNQADLIIKQTNGTNLNIDKILPADIIDLYEERAVSILNSLKIGETATVGGVTYIKRGDDDYEVIQ